MKKGRERDVENKKNRTHNNNNQKGKKSLQQKVKVAQV